MREKRVSLSGERGCVRKSGSEGKKRVCESKQSKLEIDISLGRGEDVAKMDISSAGGFKRVISRKARTKQRVMMGQTWRANVCVGVIHPPFFLSF